MTFFKLSSKNFKRSFTTRNVDITDSYVSTQTIPKEGDLVLVRVSRIRQQGRLELTDGRRAHLYNEDYVLGVAGKRYSTKYYLGEELPGEVSHLLTTSGLVGVAEQKSQRVKAPTELELIGTVVTAKSSPLNLKNFRVLPNGEQAAARPSVILVIGSDMDAGKTTLASAVIKGLSSSNQKVYGFKLTGSGSGPDYWRMKDAGAIHVSDFMEAGYVSTSGIGVNQLLLILRDAICDAGNRQADRIVLEVADGILQTETAQLIASKEFQGLVDGVFIASDSAVSAVYISQYLTGLNYRVFGVGGVFTQYPLSVDEFNTFSGYPVFTTEQLESASFGTQLREMLRVEERYAVSQLN